MPGIMVISPRADVAQANGQHHDRERRLAEDGANHQPLGHQPQQRHGADGRDHRQPERKAQHRHAGQAGKGAQHHQVALREADGFGGLVDQHKAERDQAVDAALRDTADDQLQKLHVPGARRGGGFMKDARL
jgi:hypothetical protein